MWAKFAFLMVGFAVLVQYGAAVEETPNGIVVLDDGNYPDGPIGGAPCYGTSGMGLWCRRYPWQPKCKCFWQYCKYCFPYYKNPLCQCLKDCTGY